MAPGLWLAVKATHYLAIIRRSNEKQPTHGAAFMYVRRCITTLLSSAANRLAGWSMPAGQSAWYHQALG